MRSPAPARDTPVKGRSVAGTDLLRTCLAESISAHRFPHERADPCLFGGGQLLQREGGRPHVAFVEVRLVAEADRRVPRVELLRALLCRFPLSHGVPP